MSEENQDSNERGQPKVEAKSTRNPNGTMRSGFNQYVEADIRNVKSESRNQPTDSEYTKINSRLAKQLGIADKLADYQTQYNPRDLYKMLDFMADNQGVPPSRQKQGLPPNRDFVPTSPGSKKVKLPGKAIGTQRMGKEAKFELHRSFDARELFTPKKKK